MTGQRPLKSFWYKLKFQCGLQMCKETEKAANAVWYGVVKKSKWTKASVLVCREIRAIQCLLLLAYTMEETALLAFAKNSF